MNVLDALATRYSARTFGPKKPDRQTIESIVKNAGRVPSSRNIQPWSVRIFAGEALADVVTAAATGEGRLQGLPEQWAPGMFGPNVDRAAVRRGGLRFFEAPVGVLCTIPVDASPPAWLDHGGFICAFDLAVVAFGLTACVIGDFHGMDDILAEPAGLDPERETITVGIGVGYSDRRRGVVSDRKPLDAIATFNWD